MAEEVPPIFEFNFNKDNPKNSLTYSVIHGFKECVQETGWTLNLLHLNTDDARELKEEMELTLYRIDWLRVVEDVNLQRGLARLTLDTKR